MGVGSASAGGFASARFGGAHGHPTTDNPTAIYYNPAGLALKTGTRLFVEGLLIYRDASYERPEGAITNVADGEVGTPTDAVSTNAGTASVTNFLASPFLGVASDLGVENLGVGLALFAPFGGQANWDKNNEYQDSELYPGAVDGVQRWSTMEGSIRELYVSSGVAYRLPGPRLSFGASFSLVSESVNTIRARNAAGTDDIVTDDGSLVEGRSQIDVSGVTFAAGLGVLWEPLDDLHIGLSYQSQPGFGETTQTGVLNTKLGNTTSSVADVSLLQELPDITRIGARYQAQESLELRFAADYTRWSVLTKQCIVDANDAGANCALDGNGGAVAETQGVIASIPRNWKDTFGVSAGGSYWLDEDKELAGSLSFDSNAVPDETIDPAFIDMNKLVATFGGRFKLVDDMLLNVSYSHVLYFERDVDVRERDAMDEPIGFAAPSAVPDHGGTYTQMVGLVNIGMEYMF